jgi:arylsulfatase A-like enzyme
VLRRLLDSPSTYFTLAGILFVVLLMTQFEIRPAPRDAGKIEDIGTIAKRDDVNLLFIVIDTLRADRLHVYGYPRETSPVMDQLAETGIRFNRVISQSSWTKASMASMWTSTWPQRNGILRWSHSLPPEATLPPEVFQKAGFQTAGIWRNGWVAPNFGFGQGFATYIRPQASAAVPEQFQKHTPSSGALVGTDEDATDAALEFLRGYGHKRFFLYLHYMDVHQYAYDEQSARFGTSYSDVYDNSINWVDRNIGAVVKALQDRNLQRKTVVVVASDHGEAFREHGYEGHAKMLYREVAEVPLIISLPFVLQPGVVVPDTVANVDIWPTIMDLFGLPPIDGVDGQSLLPLVTAAAKGEKSNFDRPAFAQIDRTWGRPQSTPDPIVAITRGTIRAIEPTTPSKRVAAELYDHVNDPWEKDNIAATDANGDRHLPPDLQKLVDDYLALPQVAWGKPTEVNLNEMELNQLRALGYVIK